MDRRYFLKIAGGIALAYSFSSCGRDETEILPKSDIADIAELDNDLVDFEALCRSTKLHKDFSQFIFINHNDTISAYTGRAELGQGLTTIISALLSQAFELETDQIIPVLSDTELCPNDGPTAGSSTTNHVAWRLWVASLDIKDDIIKEGAKTLELDFSEVGYENGDVFQVGNPDNRISMFKMNRDGVKLISPGNAPAKVQKYVDKKIPNVLGRKIVKGQIKYAGDLMVGEVPYAGFLTSPKFHHFYQISNPDLSAATKSKGVLQAGHNEKIGAYVVADTFTNLHKALSKIRAKWLAKTDIPTARNRLEAKEISVFREVKEDLGDVESSLLECDQILEEEYFTSPYNVSYIETPCAISSFDENENMTVWNSTQHAHHQQELISLLAEIPKEKIHVIGTQVGGGFGAKISHNAGVEAAIITKRTDLPVKVIHSRRDVFQRYARAKEEVTINFKTGVTNEGIIKSRLVNIYQDEGNGFTDTYNIENSLLKLYRTSQGSMHLRHQTVRGTSFTQDVFAWECHVDSLAHMLGIDPLEFRLKNLKWPKDVLSLAAEMIDYGRYQPPENHGIGMSVINHGGRQLGALFVEIVLNRQSGEIRVKRMKGAFDIGLVINENTTFVGIKGALLWGLSLGLKEELIVDREKIITEGFSDYDLVRFADVPEIDIRMIKNHGNGLRPRGCGEMPVPLATPAISNAFFNITGVRLNNPPFTRKKVLAALLNS